VLNCTCGVPSKDLLIFLLGFPIGTKGLFHLEGIERSRDWEVVEPRIGGGSASGGIRDEF
jgi:hypothetical protein